MSGFSRWINFILHYVISATGGACGCILLGIQMRSLQCVFTGSRNSWAENKPPLVYFLGRGISCGSCAVMPITGKGHSQPIHCSEGCSRCQNPCLSLRRPGCDPKLQQTPTQNWKLWDSMSLKAPSHLQHGRAGKLPALHSSGLPNISDLLILPEQFSVHSAAAWALSKPNDSTHHGLVLQNLPDLSTPASQKIYYTQAHVAEETRGCCSQNIKQINWLPSNTPFFFPSHKTTQGTEKLIQLSADWEKGVWGSAGLSCG